MKYWARYPFDDEPARAVGRQAGGGPPEIWNKRESRWAPDDRLEADILMDPDWVSVSEAVALAAVERFTKATA